MIEYLKGKLLKKEPTHLIIEVNGIGYGVEIAFRTSELIPKEGEKVELSTYLNVKENLMELYGFTSSNEKEVFLKLITVSGIGPRVALRILSEIEPEFLIAHILEGNVLKLTTLKGIGKKTAEVMIASLRNPLSKLKLSNSTPSKLPFGQSQQAQDAIKALIALGEKESAAQSAVEKALKNSGNDVTTSQLISESLKSK